MSSHTKAKKESILVNSFKTSLNKLSENKKLKSISLMLEIVALEIEDYIKKLTSIYGIDDDVYKIKTYEMFISNKKDRSHTMIESFSIKLNNLLISVHEKYKGLKVYLLSAISFFQKSFVMMTNDKITSCRQARIVCGELFVKMSEMAYIKHHQDIERFQSSNSSLFYYLDIEEESHHLSEAEIELIKKKIVALQTSNALLYKYYYDLNTEIPILQEQACRLLNTIILRVADVTKNYNR